MSRIRIITDIWSYLKSSGQWFLLPLIAALVVLGLLLIFAQTSPLAPFIYTLV